MCILYMSVMRPKHVQTFTAPVAVSSTDISLSGSWTRMNITDKIVCRYSVQSWCQDVGGEHADMRLDYCVVMTGQRHKFIAELNIDHQLDFEPYIAQTSDAIQRVLRKSKAHSISTMFKQDQPGATFGVSAMGTVGQGGDIQAR